MGSGRLRSNRDAGVSLSQTEAVGIRPLGNYLLRRPKMNRFSLRSRLLVGRAMGGEVIARGAAISAVWLPGVPAEAQMQLLSRIAVSPVEAPLPAPPLGQRTGPYLSDPAK